MLYEVFFFFFFLINSYKKKNKEKLKNEGPQTQPLVGRKQIAEIHMN